MPVPGSLLTHRYYTGMTSNDLRMDRIWAAFFHHFPHVLTSLEEVQSM